MAPADAATTVHHEWLGGVILCGALALAAAFVGSLTGLPPLLLVILLGASVRWGLPRLVERLAEGVQFSAKTLLRLGVALLGLRIVAGDLVALGWRAALVVILSLLVTVVGGYLVARRFRLPQDAAGVASSSVAVCGASAAIAVAAMAPGRDGLKRDTAAIVLIVSLLSTIVMVLYPLLCQALGYDGRQTSLLLGAAIHDVAQVAGAGFAVSPDVGLAAVTVKLFRVACLIPVTLAWGAFLSPRADGATGARAAKQKPPLFLLAFLGLAVLASFGVIPPMLRQAGGDVAAWCLAAAVAAIGLTTAPSDIRAASPAIAGVILITTLLQLATVVALAALIFR